MSSLYKLSIQGIRSFNCESQETIEFGVPLTLICGQNGCGKTTIIECLRYATTGDLPPNSKGGAFINDPNLANRNVVNGQIKLAFRSSNDRSMIVSRTMQLSRKKGRGGATTNTFKTLEGQLSVIKQGVKTAISSKNADLDTQVPFYLGAPSAILNYVIFCHQDDSLWPLSEASVLKKRFDEIFEALKFTKVLDNLKSIRKDMATEIKLIEQSVQHLKIDKMRAQKINDQLASHKEKIEGYTEDIVEITGEIEQYEKEASILFESNQQYSEKLSEYERLKLTNRNLSQSLERLQLSITILQSSDDELLTQLADFNQFESQKKNQIKHLETQLASLQKSIETSQTNFQEYTRLEGSLESRKLTYEKNLQTVESFMDTSKEKYHIRAPDYKRLKKLIGDKYKHESSNFENVRQSNKISLAKADGDAREFKDAISREKQHVTYCMEDISNANIKIKDLHIKLKSLQYDESTLELERTQLKSLEQKYATKKESVNLSDLEKKIDADNHQLSSLEHELDELTKKITLTNKQSDLYARLALQKESKQLKDETLANLVASNSEIFKKLTGKSLKVDNGPVILQKCIEQAAADVTAKQKAHDAKSIELNSVETLIQTREVALAQSKSSVQECKLKILEVLDEDEIPEYERIVHDLEEDHNTTLHNLNTFDVTKGFKLRAIEIAKAEKCCTLCRTPFEGKALTEFLSVLAESVQAMSVEKLKESVASTKQELANAKAIYSDVLEYRLLCVKVEDLGVKIEDGKTKLTQLTEQGQELKHALEAAKSKQESFSSLRSRISQIVKMKDDIKEVDSQLTGIEEELSDYGASSLSVSELQKLQLLKNSEIKSLRQQVSEQVESKYLQQKELSRLQMNVKDKSLAVANLEKSLSDIVNIKHSISDFEKHVESLQEKKLKSEVILTELDEKYQQAKQEYDDLVAKLQKEEDDQHAALESLKSFVKDYYTVHDSIEEYETNFAGLIDENKTNLAKVQHDIDEMNSKSGELTGQIKLLNNEIYESSSIERNIRDNIELRAIEKQLDDIRVQLNDIDIEQAEAEKENYLKKSNMLRDKLSDLNAQHAGKSGEIKQIKNQIQQLNDDLANDFKDVDQAYHEEWVKLQTQLLVSNDITTYSKALDNAIMKYHSSKMEDINRILRELWNQTYKGTDVDYIEIKSDVNVQAKGNRSYNYRVVMYKQSVELDMRGRCSAGQKVLTSILIRLALAECFGANCGMIALDEPTTNLDLDNSESLAAALNSIIELRRSQKNFQLIVITHDEKFLSHINGDKFTDHFYRVQRNESQSSIIRSLPIRLIHDE